MKKSFIAMACAVLMLAPACTKDLTEVNVDGNYQMETITYSVSFETPESVNEDGTRITLDTASNQLVWEVGDVVNIVATPSGGSATKYSSTALAEGDEAVGKPVEYAANFTFELPEGCTIHYAYSSKSQTDGTAQADRIRPRFSVRSTTDGTSGNECATHTDLGEVIRECFVTGAVNTTDKSIQLRNTAAFVEVQLEGEETVWSVDVMSKSQNLRSKYATIMDPASGEAVLSIYQNLESASVDPSSMGGAHFRGTGENGGGRDLRSGTTSFYFAMPVVDLPAGDLFIQVRTENYTRLYRSKNAHSFKRNHVTRLKPIVVTPLETSSYVALDANGQSNCYMVAPSDKDQNFVFSVQNIDGSYQIGTRSIGVWPKWATKDGLVENISVVYNSGDPLVYFTIPGGTGKGSCILTGGPINDILIGTNWTWHIWVTDAKDMTYGDPAITVLDRAPGALWVPTSREDVVAMTHESAAQTVGFMYQYGRHVPFPGPKCIGDTNLSNKWGYEGDKGTSASASARFKVNTIDVELYHFARWQNGFTIYNASSKTIEGTKYYNMAMMHNSGSWATDLTQELVNKDGVSGNTALWSVAQKGNQDPCPQGYRVAGTTELMRILREMKADGSAPLYANQYSISRKTYARETTDENKYAVDVHGSFADGLSYKSGTNAKELLGDNFIWFPHGGLRMLKQNTPAAAENGLLLNSTWYYHSGEDVMRSGIGFLWGVPDYDITAMLEAQTNIPFPTHNITTYPNLVSIPFKWGLPGQTTWTNSTLATNDISIYNDEGVSKGTIKKGGLPAFDAVPVRCVKLAE